MFLHHYQPHDLTFAYCYHTYLRWQTSRNRPYSPLVRLDSQLLNDLVEPYGIRVLESVVETTSVATLVSLQPTETISSCASKMKGRVSKWLNSQLNLTQPQHLLSGGYFARTIGKSNESQIKQYLESQPSHHGYDRRLLPPTFTKEYELSASDHARLATKHADVVAQFHIVMSSKQRRGIFGSAESSTIALEWRRQQNPLGVAIRKVSFVPDHVHIALRMHPSSSPASTVAALMNSVQEIVPDAMIRAGLDCMWEPSAYVGSYGSFATPQIAKYIQNISV